MPDKGLGNASRLERIICLCIMALAVIFAPPAIITVLTSWLISSGFYEDFWSAYITFIFLLLFTSLWVSEPRRCYLDCMSTILLFSFAIVLAVKILIIIFFPTLIAHNPEYYANLALSATAYLATMGMALVLTQNIKLFSKYLLVTLFVSGLVFVQLYSHIYFNQIP
ncbi:MAG: hypothetical protein ACPG3V_07980 [Porticoccaceae bacterium]